MKFSIFGWNFPILFGEALEKEGHFVLFNKYSPNVDVIITQSLKYIYPVYRNLKKIKKNNIKIVNFVLDIPPWRFDDSYYQNKLKNYIKTILFNFQNKNQLIHNRINKFSYDARKSRIYNMISATIQNYFNTNLRNKFTYIKNYKNFLKKSDLNLTISKFSQKLIKTFLKMDFDVCYQCVDSDLLLSIPNYPIKYDAITIGRIVETKKQEVFVKAAKKLGLKIAIFGKHEDKGIKLGCPQFYLPSHKVVMEELSKAGFYVDASIYEGFGMTPIEAVFLGKKIVTSNTYIHREILGDYPLYFKRNNVDDLVEKMKTIINGNYNLNKEASESIKKKFSIEAFRKNLMSKIESLF